MKRKVNPRSLKNLRPPWKPKQSGNLSGRPKKPISSAYAELADQPVPGDKKQRTYAQLLAEAQYHAAIKGKTDAAREIANRIEGPAEKPQQVEIISNDPIKVRVEAPDLIDALRQIYGLTGGNPVQSAGAQPVSEGVDRGPVPPEDSGQGT